MARKLIVELIGDDRSLRQALARSARGAKGFEHTAAGAGRGAAAASGAFRSMGRSIAFASGTFLGAAGLTAVLKSSISAASDLHEQINKSRVVFGKASKDIEGFASTSAKSFGIAKNDAIGMAATFGNILHPMGIARGEAAKMSVQFVKLAADMASFNNADPTEVLQAIQSGLAGQVRPLRQYGIFLSKARIEAEALSMGLLKGNVSAGAARVATEQLSVAQAKYNAALAKYGPNATQTVSAHVTLQKAQENVRRVASGVTTTLTNQQKALATTSIIMRDSADAQGDFARTSGGLANQQRILKAEIKDLEEKLGTALMPTVLKITKGMTDWLGKSQNQKKVQHDLNVIIATAGSVLRALAGIVRAISPPIRAMNSAIGGTKRSFELLFALGIAAKLRAIAISLQLVGTSAAGASGAAGIGGMTAKLGPFALAVTGAYLAVSKFSDSLNNLPGADFVNKHLGGNYLNKKLGFSSGGGTKPPMATDSIKKGYVTVFNGRTFRWTGSNWTDITPKGKGGSVSGKTGPITPGLKSVEQAVGAHVNDDFATSGHATNSYHYRGEAADLAVDRAVWAKLYANRRRFAELFGPWGLYHYGVQFYDRKLQAQHMDHIHVAYTGGPVTIGQMMSGTGGGGGASAGIAAGGGTGAGSLTVGVSPKTPVWKGATQATITSAKASVTSMITAAQQVIGGMAGPMDAIEASAIKHLQSLRAHLRIHMSANDLAQTKAEIAKWGKVLKDEVGVQTKAAKRAFDLAAKQLMRAFDKETAQGLKNLAAPDETPTEKLLRLRGEAHDDAARQQALADAQASGDARAIADALYDIETAGLEKQAAAERKAADAAAEDAQSKYQEQRDDQRQALEDQLSDWEEWLTSKKHSWNEFWAWIKANPHGGVISAPNIGETASAPTFGSKPPPMATSTGGWGQVGTGSGGWSQVFGGSGGGPPRMALGGIVTKPTLAMIGESGPEAVIPLGSYGGDTVIHNIITLDGKVLYENWKKQAGRDVTRNGGTGVRS